MRVASRPPFSSSLWRRVDAAAQPQNILDMAAAVARVTTSLSSSHVLNCRVLGASCRIVVKRIPAHPLPRGSRPPQRCGYPSYCQLDSRLKLLLPRRSSPWILRLYSAVPSTSTTVALGARYLWILQTCSLSAVTAGLPRWRRRAAVLSGCAKTPGMEGRSPSGFDMVCGRVRVRRRVMSVIPQL